MKPVLHFSLLIFIAIFLWGCPYESSYPIDKEPMQNIDEDLLGKWAAFAARPANDGETKEMPVKIIFSKRNEMEYDIFITGYIEELRRYKVIKDDTIRGTAFISTIANKEFLNTFIFGKIYIAEMRKENTFLSLFTLNEHFTSKYIKNSESLRLSIDFHYKTRAKPSYDEWFIIKNLQKVN